METIQIKLTECEKFSYFIFDTLNYKTLNERKDGSETIIFKGFKRNGKNYILIARFDKNGEYMRGFLTDDYGREIVNGNGFDFTFFLQLVKGELKAKGEKANV